MNKVGLIIIREYTSRVKKKSFIIMTMLGPILFSALFIVPIWMATREGDEKVIHVLDESGYFADEFVSSEGTTYVYISNTIDQAKEVLNSNVVFGILHIPQITLEAPSGITFYSKQNPGINIQNNFQYQIRKKIEDLKLLDSGIDREVLNNLKSKAGVQIVKVSDTGDESESSAGAASAVGYVGALLIYFFIFLYGAQIMRGVVEEKTSRIIEVILASVKPFQLMMGKIIGVAAVGLTQFVLWVFFSAAIVFGGSSFLVGDVNMNQEDMMGNTEIIVDNQSAPNQEIIQKALVSLKQMNMPFIIGCFLFYFLGGYLCYGALFAAIGSAVDGETDAQQFMMPVTLPLIFSTLLMSAVINEPNGTLAFWLSIIPFTSPVIMMMRIPFDVPTWQILLSMFCLISGFTFTTWVASRIYRVGIFVHGTKINYKTLAKWFIMKN